ncbi:hypothetical protein YC2023_002409 [Brassica napus]
MDSAASPSSLPSSVSHNWEYRVFPSFCEEEISRGFFGYFKKEFERKGIKLFIDRRESFGPGLIEAIRRSRIAIVILSKHYASSTLRLDELVEIMKCREELGAADVKKQSGYFGSVFEKACVGRSVEDVEKWKRALNELSFIFGYLSGNWKSEDDMMEEVANNLSNMLNKAAPSTDFDGFVGMENHITQISSLLSLDFVDDVRMVGIWGPAGIGKTTVARALYWKLSNNFEVTDFMESIRGSPENHHPFVLNLQEQYRKVLLVLDDVHDSKQLKAMAGNPQWFGRGSRIIITTNDKKLLKAHGIDQIYHVEFPSTLEALEIFCLYAFDQKSPYDGFEELSMEITGLAGNLPLGLSVFGSYLRGMSKGEWMHALPRLRTSLDANTEKALRCDYETLCDKEKALFLHIACFFKGERTSNLGEYFSNLDIRRGLQVLAEKSLISIDNGARLVMHNLLELLGLEISRKEYIDENRRRAREIGDVLADDTGYVSARGTDHVLTAIKDEISIDERANERTLDSLPALSPLPSNCTHHVFASFRGVDVRKSFLRHMLMVLRNKGITLFTDIEIETGTSIVHELKEAIHRSRISIILISNKSVEDVEKWKRALDEVSNIFRYVSRSWEMEEIIEKVANNLSDLLYEDVPSGDFDGLVGMENHIMQISSLLSLDSDDVRMVGIWGPSGIGKTTTARALYRKLSSNFTHTAFMESIKAIREEIHTDDHAYMLYLQEKLLCQTFNHMGLEIHHLGVAEKRLKDKKVLVVLDDVDDLKQLKAMAKKTQWFGNGSRIIITTTDKKLLKAHGINDIYHVEFPCASDALEILCLHAFGQKSPYLGFEELAMDVTQLADILTSFDLSLVRKNEAEMIENVATDISNKLNMATASRDFDGLVGMENHITQISSMLSLDSNDVRMVGILGPAGIGKTTIARALYNKLSNSFTHTAFMESIRGSGERTHSDDYAFMLHLQEQFLSKTFNHKDLKIHHLGVAEERLKDKKVLLVLDDVVDLKQLKAMAGNSQWFGCGSRIIMTTKAARLLEAHGIDHIYHVGLPSLAQAYEIFCLYAFGQKFPYDGYEDLAMEVTGLAGDLPLGLRVFGSHLRGMSKEEWIEALPRLRTSLDGDIEKVLRFSYEALCDKDKDLFLHIACLFEGESISYLEKCLAHSDLDVRHGLKVLANNSLISITEEERLVMHNLVEQLGKEIVRQEHKDEPERRKFLVDAREICDVLTDNTGSKSVLGIDLDIMAIKDELCIDKRAFEGMTRLQFLRFKSPYGSGKNNKLILPQGLNNLPRKLRLLCWDEFPLRCLPPDFAAEFLVILEMRNSSIEKLWEGSPLMDMSYSLKLKDIPNVSNATNLETLILNGCESLVEIPTWFKNLSRLTHLKMVGCKKLKDLPTNINMESLYHLDLSHCTQLKTFPEISTRIGYLDLENTGIEEVPSSIRSWPDFAKLSMRGCKSLRMFPDVLDSMEELN